MVKEVWKDVVGYEGLYKVSDQGRVRSLRRTVVHSNGRRRFSLKEKILVPAPGGAYGHLYVCLTDKTGVAKTTLLHRLVLKAFVGPAPEGCEGCHNSGDSDDNRLANLRWDTKQSNMADRKLHGNHRVGSASNAAKLNEGQIPTIREKLRRGVPLEQIAKEFSVSVSSVKNVRSGKTWAHVEEGR